MTVAYSLLLGMAEFWFMKTGCQWWCDEARFLFLAVDVEVFASKQPSQKTVYKYCRMKEEQILQKKSPEILEIAKYGIGAQGRRF